MFRELRRAVDTLESVARDLEPGCLDAHDAATLLEVATRGKRVCGAIETLLAARAAESGIWRREGHRSAAHWFAATSGDTLGAASRALDTARSLDALPATDEAFRAGALSAVQVAEIASAAGADPDAEAPLLEAATSSSVKGLRDRCREVRAGAEPDDAAWARRLHEGRRAHEWTDPDGFYRLDGRLPPDGGGRFSSAWNAHIDRIYREGRRAGRREPRAAYAADALVALAEEGPCKATELRVVADHTALARGHARAGERCEITGVGPVPVAVARRVLNDAVVTLMAREGNSITEVSRPTRTIPAKLRRALEARYPTCGVKTCANDRFLQIDHVEPLEAGGETNVHNTWRLCSHHHALKTYAGWRVTGTTHDWGLEPPDPVEAGCEGRSPP